MDPVAFKQLLRAMMTKAPRGRRAAAG